MSDVMKSQFPEFTTQPPVFYPSQTEGQGRRLTDDGVRVVNGFDELQEQSTPQQKNEPALRFDAGKPRFDLFPTDALEELAYVYGAGADEYGEDNWAAGMSWRRCIGSTLRHTFKFLSGEDYDKKSGRLHMAHAAWNCLTLVAYQLRKIGVDNRYKA